MRRVATTVLNYLGKLIRRVDWQRTSGRRALSPFCREGIVKENSEPECSSPGGNRAQGVLFSHSQP